MFFFSNTWNGLSDYLDHARRRMLRARLRGIMHAARHLFLGRTQWLGRRCVVHAHGGALLDDGHEELHGAGRSLDAPSMRRRRRRRTPATAPRRDPAGKRGTTTPTRRRGSHWEERARGTPTPTTTMPAARGLPPPQPPPPPPPPTGRRSPSAGRRALACRPPTPLLIR